MSEWQPIETAPKDGEMILLVQGAVSAGKHMTWGPFVGFFSSLPEDETHPWRFFDGTCPINGWQETNGPTHWMPLPEPPL